MKLCFGKSEVSLSNLSKKSYYQKVSSRKVMEQFLHKRGRSEVE